MDLSAVRRSLPARQGQLMDQRDVPWFVFVLALAFVSLILLLVRFA
jgi:hypothetical protein